jgi:hypothetical protein
MAFIFPFMSSKPNTARETVPLNRDPNPAFYLDADLDLNLCGFIRISKNLSELYLQLGSRTMCSYKLHIDKKEKSSV